jgi:UDP-glucose 4-epimerase
VLEKLVVLSNSNADSIEDMHVVFGGLGFIGINLVQLLIQDNKRCLVIDNRSISEELLSSHFTDLAKIELLALDMTLPESWETIREKCGSKKIFIWHLAANSDIAQGSQTSIPDVQDTFFTTVQLIESLKYFDCSGLVFASSSAVYGHVNSDIGFSEEQVCRPESFYGVAKLSSEHVLRISLQRLQVPLWIFRFANIVGAPATHGVIYDLLLKIRQDPSQLRVLGDGNQRKTYLHVQDLVEKMLELISFQKGGIWNLGPGDDGILVSRIVELISKHVAPNAKISFGEQAFGWLGDVPVARMNCDRLLRDTAKVQFDSESAVHLAIHEIAQQLGMEFKCVSV